MPESVDARLLVTGLAALPPHHFESRKRVQVHLNKPKTTLASRTDMCKCGWDIVTWIRFLPSGFVTRGCSFGVVKV